MVFTVTPEQEVASTAGDEGVISIDAYQEICFCVSVIDANFDVLIGGRKKTKLGTLYFVFANIIGQI
ncbi:hypothetical protein [Roseibium sp.]|uniref:hypothetical protein n=1 Tax=Roseibium sp. TaxID=1936156 RepID=UPI003BAE6807